MSLRKNPWLLVAVLWVVACLNYLDRQVIFSMLPLLRTDLGLSDVQLGLIGTAFLWVYAFLSPVCGFLADRFGRERVIMASLFVWSAVTWGTAYVASFGQLIAMRALMGISEAFYLPAALALIADRHSGKTRSLATGLHISGIYFGMIIGGGGGGWLGEHYGWRAAFVMLGVIGVAYIAVLVPFLSGHRGTASAAPVRFGSSVRELMSLPGFRGMTVVFITTSLANWTLYTWLALFLYERFSLSLAEAGMSVTYIQIASITGILAGGWIADRWSATNPRARIITQTIGLLSVSPALLIIGITYSRPLLFVGLMAFGLGKGFYDANIMPALCQIARPELRSTGYGIFNLMGCLAGGFAAPLAGALKQAIGIGGSLQLAALILLFSIPFLFRIRMPEAVPVSVAS